MKKITSFLLFSCIVLFGFGQNMINNSNRSMWGNNPLNQEECKTGILLQEQLNNDPAFAQQFNNYKILAKKGTQNNKATLYTIPIVVHVIHLGEPVGTGTNISDAQIHSAINNLNQAFRNQAPYTGVDMEIEFCLASVDPSNNPTSGINRVDGSGTSDYATQGITNDGGSSMNEVAVKALSNWGNTNYYQFWIVAGIDGNMGGGGTQGYAYFSQAASKDGAVVLYNSFGYDPTGSLCYNLKSYTNRNVTTIHEVGHALGLYHSFEGDGTGSSCPTNGNCSTDGDEVCDTPPHMRSSSDCDFSGTNTCTGGSKSLYVHNFMDYSSDDCQTEFTAGQKTKARNWLTAVRNSLTTSTKCTPVAAPISEFTTVCESQSGCAGSSIDFFDLSTGNPTSWSWSFPGGTPASSTSQYPSITYNTPGTYAVSLTATNSFGTGNTETKNGFITIYSSPTAACTNGIQNSGYFGYAISDVQFNTISNSTSPTTNGYVDNSCSFVTTVNAGQSYNLSIDVEALGGQTGFHAVYIDYNNNGTLDDASETVMSGSLASGSGATTFNTNVVIPGTAVTGTLLRMRVINDQANLSGPCDNLFTGEAEDYGIYISSGCTDPDVPTISGTTTICNGDNTILSIASGNLNDASDWQWYTTSCGGTSAGNGTSINVSPTSNTTYYVRGEGGCVTPGSCAQVTVTVNDVPGNAGSITGSNSVCENASGIGYSITPVSGATSYNWTLPTGASITAGNNTNSITVTFGTTSGTVEVTPVNACGNGGSSNMAVTVNSCGSAPVADFSGTPTTLCEGNTVSFTDLSTNTPTGWSWSFPGGTPSSSSSQNPTITYNTAGTYQVQLTANNAFGNDSETKVGYIIVNACGSTKLRNSDCGITMTSYLNYITCDWVNGAQEYEYEFVNTGLGYNQTFVRSNPNYRFVYVNQVPGILDGTTYDVRVRAKVGGTYGSYGTVCQITTPGSSITTNLVSNDCGIILPSYNDYIICEYVSQATEYEYEFVNSGLGYNQTYVRSNPSYRHVYMNNVPGILDGTTYDVRVRAKIGGSYTSYGSICQVTTPAGLTTKLRDSDCGVTMVSFSNYINCDYVSGATEYEYEFINAGLSYNQTYVRSNPSYRFLYVDSMPGIQLSTTYDVRVRAKVGGSYTSYGPVCQVTTPASARLGDFTNQDGKVVSETSDLEMIIYPNPNQGEFVYLNLRGLEVNTEIFITDISGKIIQQQQINSSAESNNSTIRFSEKLNSGFYMITVISGNQKITKKLIVR